jgi:hypothetical protein
MFTFSEQSLSSTPPGYIWLPALLLLAMLIVATWRNRT